MVKTIVEPSTSMLANSKPKEDYLSPTLLKFGESDGFKWYIGEYHLPFSSICGPATLEPVSPTVRIAYVDVTGTKLDGVTDFRVVDHADIDLHCGCTFAGTGEMASLLRCTVQDSQNRWYIGEDYAHSTFDLIHGSTEEAAKLETIEAHLKNETIPSIIKALVEIDLKNPDFDGQTI